MDVALSSSPLLQCNYDILFAICKEVWNLPRGHRNQEHNPQAFAQTCHRIRHFMAPDLYKTIHVGPEWDWDRALSALESVQKCKSVKQYTRTFVIDLSVDPDNEGLTPPKELPTKLAAVLASLTKLEAMTIVLPIFHVEPFHKAFRTAKVTLPTVTRLKLGAHVEWVVAMCPSVNSISEQDMPSNMNGASYEQRKQYVHDLVKAACDTKDLQHLAMTRISDQEVIEPLISSHPNILSLSSETVRTPGRPYRSSWLWSMRSRKATELASIYGRFLSLRTVVLPPAYQLGVGFSPPRCGNVYMGPNGGKVRMKVEAQRREADNRVATIMFNACPKLETLWIGEYARAICTRSETGTVNSVHIEAVRRDYADW